MVEDNFEHHHVAPRCVYTYTLASSSNLFNMSTYQEQVTLI